MARQRQAHERWPEEEGPYDEARTHCLKEGKSDGEKELFQEPPQERTRPSLQERPQGSFQDPPPQPQVRLLARRHNRRPLIVRAT